MASSISIFDDSPIIETRTAMGALRRLLREYVHFSKVLDLVNLTT